MNSRYSTRGDCVVRPEPEPFVKQTVNYLTEAVLADMEHAINSLYIHIEDLANKLQPICRQNDGPCNEVPMREGMDIRTDECPPHHKTLIASTERIDGIAMTLHRLIQRIEI